MPETNRHTLANGLRIVHRRDTSTAMAAVDVIYNVGSRHEEGPLTGTAHLMEHLMFGGSANVPDFDKALERAGGTNNAWTNQDFTNYYDIVPAHNIETAFWVESDRMQWLDISERAVEVQRQVVVEEFKQVCLNQPYGDMFHHVDALAYERHPYRTPVIGATPDHILATTVADVERFYRRHYNPANAVLSVVGNVEFDRVVWLAERWFGPIEGRTPAPAAYRQEPEQTSPRRMTVSGNVPHVMIVKAFHMPGFCHPDYPAADLISDLLAAGRASRFYRNLMMVPGALFSQADASVTGTLDPGLLLLTGVLSPGADVDEADMALIGEAMSLVSRPPSTRELERVLNRFESTHVFSHLNFAAQASALAQSELRGDDFDRTVECYRRLTPERITDVAASIIAPQRCSTLIYTPA